MTTVYRLNVNELDFNFVESIRAAFKNKEIEITVCECDETAYLLGSSANRDHLLSVIKDIDQQQKLITPDQALFQ